MIFVVAETVFPESKLGRNGGTADTGTVTRITSAMILDTARE